MSDIDDAKRDIIRTLKAHSLAYCQLQAADPVDQMHARIGWINGMLCACGWMNMNDGELNSQLLYAAIVDFCHEANLPIVNSSTHAKTSKHP
jgi:hypothetical protein